MAREDLIKIFGFDITKISKEKLLAGLIAEKIIRYYAADMKNKINNLSAKKDD